MCGVRPEGLTDRELEKYAYLAMTAEGLPKAYAEELLKRFSERVMEEYRHPRPLPALLSPTPPTYPDLAS